MLADGGDGDEWAQSHVTEGGLQTWEDQWSAALAGVPCASGSEEEQMNDRMRTLLALRFDQEPQYTPLSIAKMGGLNTLQDLFGEGALVRGTLKNHH